MVSLPEYLKEIEIWSLDSLVHHGGGDIISFVSLTGRHRSRRRTGSITGHGSATTAAAPAPPDSAAADPRGLLPPPPPPPRSPNLPLRRRQVLWPRHHRQRDPREEGRLLHRRRERAVGIPVQVL